MYPRYQSAPHIDYLDWALMQVVHYVETDGKQGFQKLLVMMPPRHSKTFSAAELLPTWFIGRNPEWRVILTAYGATLAQRSSRRARNYCRSPRYKSLFDLELAKDSSAVDSWSLSGYEGGMDAMGILGGVTGKGAHLIIGDDLLKNRESAESETIREKIWDAWQADFLTRVNSPYAGQIMFATRWNIDDPPGRVLLKELKDWYVICLPAIATEDVHIEYGEGHVYERKAGEALWQARYPLTFLKKQEEILGLYNFSSLYQQNPVPGEGGFFKREWFKTVSETPEIVFSARYWDLAMSDKPTADYTVGLKIGLGMDGHYYILDVVRERVDWGELVGFMADVMLKDGPAVSQGVEKAGYMTRAVSDLNADHRLHGFSVMGYDVDTKKHIRALPVQGKFQSNMISLVRAHWNDAYIDEMCAFTPKGAVHDDQVDATSGAWVMMDGQAMMEGYTSW